MMRRWRASVWAASVGLGLLSLAAGVQAYCPLTTVMPPPAACPEPCELTGKHLRWAARDITYAFNVRGFHGLDDRSVRRMFAQAFGTWEAVDCDGEPLGFAFNAARDETFHKRAYLPGGPNQNVILYLTAEEWDEQSGHSPQAFALTHVGYTPSTGRIEDVDMEFNGGMPPFGECPPAGCPGGLVLTDLRNVATHEIGHLLGLAHSEQTNATMSCDALPGDTNKRTLGLDDARGVCAAYSPGGPPLDSDLSSAVAAPSDGGCSLPNGTTGDHHAGLLLALCSVGWAARRRLLFRSRAEPRALTARGCSKT